MCHFVHLELCCFSNQKFERLGGHLGEIVTLHDMTSFDSRGLMSSLLSFFISPHFMTKYGLVYLFR